MAVSFRFWAAADLTSLGAVTEAEVPSPTLVPPRPEGASTAVVVVGADVVVAVVAPKLNPEPGWAAPNVLPAGCVDPNKPPVAAGLVRVPPSKLGALLDGCCPKEKPEVVA